MKVGVILPSFRTDASALDAAAEAEAKGVHGVFCYDHLWPMAQPERPALNAFPLLGAVAARTRAVSFGPLVARIGLAPDGVLVASLLSLARLGPSRFICAMGTGDSLSRAENEAFGVPFDPAALRRRSLEECARRITDAGVPVWVGGRHAATLEIALATGAAVNLWDASADEVAAAAARTEVTWSGPLSGDAVVQADRLRALAAAGATWAVVPWPARSGGLDTFLAAAAAARQVVSPG